MIALALKIRGREQPAVFLTPAQAKAIAKFGRSGTVSRIKELVAEHFHIPPEKLEARDRRWKYSKPRQVAMYLARETTDKSYPWIADCFGLKDHTTVLYAHRRIEQHIEDRDELGIAALELRERLAA